MNLLERTLTPIFKVKAAETLGIAGIEINGPRRFDIQVHDERFYTRVALQGELGFGEAYVDGLWDCKDIAGLIDRILRASVHKNRDGISGLMLNLQQRLMNLQNQNLSRRVAVKHYDLGSDFYTLWLDRRMVYSCGYWQRASTLGEAQEDKFELVCRKLGLKAGDRVLEIGCGWGSFARYAAERHGVMVIGVTISKDQADYAQKYCEYYPVRILCTDYRNIPREFDPNSFDHIVSIGMFEHVGPKNYREYMQIASSMLKPEGLFLLHTIGGIYGGQSAFIDKYIFPGGYIPTMSEIDDAVRGLLVKEDLENFGPYYERTLLEWWRNFERAWPQIQELKDFDDRFYRMWRYYLLTCAGAFRARKTQLWQIVLSRGGTRGVWRRCDHMLLPAQSGR